MSAGTRHAMGTYQAHPPKTQLQGPPVEQCSTTAGLPCGCQVVRQPRRVSAEQQGRAVLQLGRATARGQGRQAIEQRLQLRVWGAPGQPPHTPGQQGQQPTILRCCRSQKV
jgi:hypothetical protein